MHQPRKATFAPLLTAAILLALTGTSVLTAQAVRKSSVDVTVTDPLGRTVAGLDKSRFTVIESGVQRPITGFSELRDKNADDAAHYRIEFEPAAGQGARVEIALDAPHGLPPLTLTWK